MVLINVQGNRTEKLGVFAKFVPLSVPVGIGALAAYLIKHGHQVKIWDEGIKMLNIEDIKALVQENQEPYVFGLSCLTASIHRAHYLARQIKKIIPHSIVILGGIHPTVLPDESLSNKEVDFVIRKEGEVALESLYRALKNKDNYENINGISFKKDGKIIHNLTIPAPEMSCLPAFPYYLFEKNKDRYDFGFVVSSRGCPYDCIFCSQRSITGRRFTSRTPQQVIEDIDLLVNKYKQSLITFSDDNMLTNKQRIKELCEIIVKKGFNKQTAFQCQVRGDSVNDDILKSLEQANFITLDYGLETASERLMVLINKGETVEENIRALELSKKYKFQLSGTFILGLPGETKKERYQSYALARKYLDYVRFNNATPYPGTKLYEIAKQEGRLNVGKNWDNLNACGTLVEGPFSKKRLAYVPLGSSELELKTDILKYNLFFSVRWKVIKDLLSRKSGTVGWFRLPSLWFFKKELFYLFILAFKVIKSWAGLFILMAMVFIKNIIDRFRRVLMVR